MSDIEKLADDELLAVAGGIQDNVTVAYQVLRGEWGNGEERKRRLRAAGYDPYAIQQIVNYLWNNQPRYNNYRGDMGANDPYLGR